MLPYNWSSNGKKGGVCCNAICKHGESIVQQRKSIYWTHAGSTTLEMVTTPQAFLLFCYAISTPLRFHEMTAVEMKPWRYFCMQSLSWRAPIRGMYISQLEEQKKKVIINRPKKGKRQIRKTMTQSKPNPFIVRCFKPRSSANLPLVSA